ncbi:MAG: methyltransferase domain-containing protein, partial [Alphaproteobacteria bacterium]
KKRLHAWWEGYELPPLEAGDEAANDSAPPGGADAGGDAPAGDTVNDAPEWSAERQKLVEIIWGEGFAAPGGEERVVDLAQPFGLTSENSMLEIGSGPGGGACAVSEKIGAYVDGFDLNGEMAKKSMEIALLRGLESKAKVKAFDPQKLDLKKEYYDGCLIRETLMSIEDKEALLDIVMDALKPEKPLVIAEMFIEGREPADLAKSSINGEFGDVYPCNVERIESKIIEAGFKIRVNNDETEAYVAMARAAWADVAERLRDEELQEVLADALLRETSMWERRIAAFEGFELKMQRIVAFKLSREIV